MKIFLFVLPLCALAGCSTPPAQTFQPLDYSYLPPIVLKVSSVNVMNNYVPTPSQATLAGENPAPPESTLLTMLNHRLVPSGQPGTGTVTVQTASIDQVGGNLTGQMVVDVNLASADGRATGFTEASVSASQTAPDSDASQGDMQAALYGLTKRMMDAMNVQLQYQIQHNLPSWVSWTATPGSVAPAATAAGGASTGVIQATPLTAPGGATPAATPAASTPATPVNTNPAVPNYLPGAGPAALGQGQAQ
jgi:hypothetical protein